MKLLTRLAAGLLCCISLSLAQSVKPFGYNWTTRTDSNYSAAGVQLLNSSIALDLNQGGTWNPCCVILQQPLPSQGSIEITFYGRLWPDPAANALSMWVYDDMPGAIHPEFVDIEPSCWNDKNNPRITLSCWQDKNPANVLHKDFGANLYTQHRWTIGLYGNICRARCDGLQPNGKDWLNYAYAEFPVPFVLEHHTLRLGCLQVGSWGPAEFRGPSRYTITSVKILP